MTPVRRRVAGVDAGRRAGHDGSSHRPTIRRPGVTRELGGQGQQLPEFARLPIGPLQPETTGPRSLSERSVAHDLSPSQLDAYRAEIDGSEISGLPCVFKIRAAARCSHSAIGGRRTSAWLASSDALPSVDTKMREAAGTQRTRSRRASSGPDGSRRGGRAGASVAHALAGVASPTATRTSSWPSAFRPDPRRRRGRPGSWSCRRYLIRTARSNPYNA